MTEMVITLTIISITMGLVLPSYQDWLQNNQIRTAAESIEQGLHLARAEALRRNTNVRFQLTSSTDNACVLSAASGNWLISQDDPSGSCGSAPSDVNAPRIIQAHAAAVGGANTVVAASQPAIIFTPLGTQKSINPNVPVSVNINISNPSLGNCVDNGGKARCLRIVVSTWGQIRLCDPALPANDSQAC